MEKKYRIETFDIINLCLLSISIIVTVALIYNSLWKPLILSSIVSILTASILGGRIVAPFYLEATIVYFLQINSGSLAANIIENSYSYSSEILERLKNRKNIVIEKNIVILNDQNIQKGLKNFIMRWALIGVKSRAKKRQK